MQEAIQSRSAEKTHKCRPVAVGEVTSYVEVNQVMQVVERCAYVVEEYRSELVIYKIIWWSKEVD